MNGSLTSEQLTRNICLHVGLVVPSTTLEAPGHFIPQNIEINMAQLLDRSHDKPPRQEVIAILLDRSSLQSSSTGGHVSHFTHHHE